MIVKQQLLPPLQSQYLSVFQRQLLETSLKEKLSPEYRQRIDIMLLADVGHSQIQICRLIGCSPLTARHWMMMAKTNQAHLWQEQPIGRPKTVNEHYLRRLLEVASTAPEQLGYEFPQWTGEGLRQHLAAELGISVSARHINRLLKESSSDAKNKNLVDSLGTAD
jgi:transposase